MVWAASLVHDAVTLQELLELLGTVAWTIVTLDYMRQTLLIDNHRQFYAHGSGGRIGQFPHKDVFGKDICKNQKVHSFPIE